MGPTAAARDLRDRMFWRRLLRAGLLTGILDGLFSSALVVFAYGSSVERLWQGVAAVLLGGSALDGGIRTAAIGLALHFGVAFAWSAAFVLAALRVPWVRRTLTPPSPLGVAEIAALYGPFVWLAMSLAVIPLFTQRPPTIGFRWWVQLLGHIPFVGVPIVAASVTRPR